jgi:hypothetical protein
MGAVSKSNRKLLLQLQKKVPGTLNLNLRMFSLNPFYTCIFYGALNKKKP